MDIDGEYRLGAPPEAVWQRLNDPGVLAACIPGCESMDRIDDDSFECLILAKYGPVKARFTTTIALSNVSPPVSYTLTGRGQGGAAGFGEGSADVVLEPADDGTVLRYQARFTAGGRIAQVGSRLILSTTRKLAANFFESFSAGFTEPGEA